MSNGLNTLESLTDTTINSALGYEKAAEVATNAGLATTLRECARERRQLVGQMNAQIVQMGGTAREDGSFSGGAHRVWTDLTTAFGNQNESAIERVEEGEEYLKEKFEAVLKDDSISAPARQIVQQGHTQICEGERMAERLEKQFD